MTKKDIINKYLGVPYLHQGRSMQGLDCYGLVILIYADLGIKVFDIDEDYTMDWSWKNKNNFIEDVCKSWQEVKIPDIFDVITFKNNKGIMNHAGIMLDNERFINTCSAGTIVSKLDHPLWLKRFKGFYRHKELN